MCFLYKFIFSNIFSENGVHVTKCDVYTNLLDSMMRFYHVVYFVTIFVYFVMQDFIVFFS